MVRKLAWWGACLLAILVMSGCSSQEDEWRLALNDRIVDAQSSLKKLDRGFNNGSMRNVAILKFYADEVKKIQSGMYELIHTLGMDATKQGPLYKNIQLRLSDAKAGMEPAIKAGKQKVEALYQELQYIVLAADTKTYNQMLTDPINVLADMSNGKLARVEAMSKTASARTNSASDYGAGSQLIGNPNYGQWNNQGGGSFWEWYGKYALFSSLFNRRSVSYSSWGHNRDYSYYNDYGRDRYTSPSQYKQQQTAQKKAENKFKQSGKSFSSPYAKTRSGSRTSVDRFKTPSRFQSSYSKPSSSSTSAASNSSSFRSGYSRTSRSSSSGK
jgi:hypothetical protein